MSLCGCPTLYDSRMLKKWGPSLVLTLQWTWESATGSTQNFWVIRSGVGPENVHFSEVPRWYWCFESENHWYRPAFEKIWLWREKECAAISGKSKNDKMIINKMVIGLGIAQTSLINHIPFYLASIVLGCIFLFYNLLLF